MQSTSNAEINYLHVMSILFPRIKDSGKSDEALYLEQKLSRVILNLGIFSEVICTQFMEDAHLPRVVCTVFDFPH